MLTRISVPFDGEVSFSTASKSRLYAVEDGTIQVDAEDVADVLRAVNGSTIAEAVAEDSKPEKAANSSSKPEDKE